MSPPPHRKQHRKLVSKKKPKHKVEKSRRLRHPQNWIETVWKSNPANRKQLLTILGVKKQFTQSQLQRMSFQTFTKLVDEAQRKD